MILPFKSKKPEIHTSALVVPTATIIGDVEIGEDSSVWFHCVVRGDIYPIRIGKRTNIQDLTMIHVTGGVFDTVIGDDVTVGHRAILHGCHVGNRILVGMGAMILDGATIGDDCLIAAGTLITPGTQIPSGSLVLGSPGQVKRPLRENEYALIRKSAANYVSYAKEYGKEPFITGRL